MTQYILFDEDGKVLCNVRLNTKYVLGAAGSGALSEVINNSIMLGAKKKRKRGAKGKCPVVEQNKGMSLPVNGAC